jgi:putative lipoic acid-binding regulatory protein
MRGLSHRKARASCLTDRLEAKAMSSDQPTLLEFPCRFPIKAMGRANSALADKVESLVRRHAPDITADDIQIRPSAKGNYLAITITVNATSREQLDAIYMDLSADENILMAL